jgi:hypothetical protein
MAGAGIATLIGDATLSPTDPNTYGYALTVRYIYPLKSERWNITGEISSSTINQKGISNEELFSAAMQQTYVGVGCRFYVTRTIKRYNPWLGEFLPYVEMSAGMIRNTIVHREPFGRHELNASLSINTRNTATYNLQLSPGFLIVLSDKIAVDFFSGIRYGFADNWDGIIGSSGLGDIYLHGGAGLNYAF